MKHYYSKVEPDVLLHIVNRLSDIEGRTEVMPEDNFLQCASLKFDACRTFPAHYHIKKDRRYKEQIAQESWVVVKGRVKCIFYDLDHKIIATPILEAGDASYTLYGGHTYEILEEGTIVYEYKTGPYEGQKLDKRFIEDDKS